MSMGMMMLPPVVVSLPFKLIFFVLVDRLVAGGGKFGAELRGVILCPGRSATRRTSRRGALQSRGRNERWCP
jgi:hypothetical protein